MKKTLLTLLACLPLAVLASPFIDDDNVLRVDTQQKTLFIHTNYAQLSTKTGKHYAMLACENAALSDEWQGVRFEKIRVLNASNNQGVEWAVSIQWCKKMIDADLSNAYIERHYFVDPYFRKF